MRPLPILRLLGLAAVALGASCVSGTAPLVVTGFHPLTPDPAAGCTVASGAAQLTGGMLDSTKGTGYIVGVSVLSELGDNSDKLRTSTNDAIIDQVVTKYRTDGTLGPPPGQTIALTGVIAPGAELSLPITILTTQNGQGLAGQSGGLLVDLTLKGHLEDGTPWQTATSTFPITVCSGCLKLCSDAAATATCGPDASGQPDGRVCPSTGG